MLEHENALFICHDSILDVALLWELLSYFQVFDLSEEAPDKVLHRLYANIERHKMGGDILAVQICRTLRLIVSVNTFRIQIILYRDGCLFSFAILVFLTQRNSTRLQVVMVQLAGCLGWSVTLSLLTHLQSRLCLWEQETTFPFHLDG